MSICFDNPIGNSDSQLVSRVSLGKDGIGKKSAAEPASFLSLFQKAFDSGEQSAALSAESSSAKAKKALQLCQRMKQDMNESLLRIMSDTETEGENGVENSLMDDLSDMLSRGKKGEELLSTIGQTPSEIELSRKELPGQINKKRTNSEKAQPEVDAIEGIIRKASEAYGVDFELIRGVVQAESSFKADAISPKGAMGLMQLMPKTAKELGVTDPMDPTDNIMGGTRYLKKLLDRYDGSVPLALAAYNWGMGNLDSRRSQMPAETRNYVAKITGTTFA